MFAVTVTGVVPTVLKLPSDTVKPTEPVLAVQLAAMVALTLPLALLTLPSVSPELEVGVPTVSEAGLPGFEASSWFGIITPAKTPKAVVDRLRSEIAAALKDPEMQNRFAASGARLVGNTPEQFGVQIAEDRARWEKVITAAGIKLQ